MIKKLTRHGNSVALVLDKPVLDSLGLHAESAVNVEQDGKSLLVTPASKASERRRFRRAMNRVNREWADVFKKLAK